MDLTSRARAMVAADNLRKILAGEPGISTGTLVGSGAVTTQREIDKIIPQGFIAIVDNTTRQYTRMPDRAFVQAVDTSSMSEKQKVNILMKAGKKDKEVFTSNKKMLKSVKQDKVKKSKPRKVGKLKKANTSFKSLY